MRVRWYKTVNMRTKREAEKKVRSEKIIHRGLRTERRVFEHKIESDWVEMQGGSDDGVKNEGGWFMVQLE